LQEVDYSLEISINEWHEIWKKYDPKHVVPWQTEYLKFMFFLIDASGDKVRAHSDTRHIHAQLVVQVIDEGEYAEVLKLYDVSETASLRSFKKLALVGALATRYGCILRAYRTHTASRFKSATVSLYVCGMNTSRRPTRTRPVRICSAPFSDPVVSPSAAILDYMVRCCAHTIFTNSL
jgi:hypothetical protein